MAVGVRVGLMCHTDNGIASVALYLRPYVLDTHLPCTTLCYEDERISVAL